MLAIDKKSLQKGNRFFSKLVVYYYYVSMD